VKRKEKDIREEGRRGHKGRGKMIEGTYRSKIA
jgi:hypothetical protein